METRGAGKRQPLTSPKSSSMRDFVRFFQLIYKEATEFKIWDPVQAMGWQITYGGTSIPIGVASVWHEFGPERQHYQMSWLSGCTAVIAVVSYYDISAKWTETDNCFSHHAGYMLLTCGKAVRMQTGLVPSVVPSSTTMAKWMKQIGTRWSSKRLQWTFLVSELPRQTSLPGPSGEAL